MYGTRAVAQTMLGGWVHPHREQQTIPQGQTSLPPKSFSTPTANYEATRLYTHSHELPALSALAQHISHSHSGIDEKRRTEKLSHEIAGTCGKKSELDALGVLNISRGCFERCCSNKKTPPYHSNLSFATLRNQRPTLLRAPAYRTPSEARRQKTVRPRESVRVRSYTCMHIYLSICLSI